MFCDFFPQCNHTVRTLWTLSKWLIGAEVTVNGVSCDWLENVSGMNQSFSPCLVGLTAALSATLTG